MNTTKIRGTQRWKHRDDQTDLLAGEIQADSLSNSIGHYVKRHEYPPWETIEKWEVQSSRILGHFRSLLGRAKWLNQIQLKRWINPAPNQQPLPKEAGRA